MNPEFVNGLFLLAGVLLTSAFTWYLNKRNRSRSELTILTSYLARLIEVDSSISEIVEIHVNGVAVPTVYTLDARIVNTGTVPLYDGNVYVTLDGNTKVLAVDIVDFPDGASNALRVQPNEQKEGYQVHFQYINPGEEFLLRAILDSPSSKVVPSFRQPGVITHVRTENELAERGVLNIIIFEIIRRNWPLHLYFRLSVPAYRRYLDHEDGDKRLE